ncbi:MAG TPA: ATP-dependent DNA ligase [Steroidobacteraceae bacterium]|nr:ATP-dependent DNA ligase [Steroidobacteraceae bacterium]
MSSLAELVAAAGAVAADSSRLAKVRALAKGIRGLAPDEIATGVEYLSGELPQGRIGIGPAVVQAARAMPPASAPSLSVREVDRRLEELASMRGSGAPERRAVALRELFAHATAPEQDVLARLLLGELRQGALTGVMVDAVAHESAVPVAGIRRAAMYSQSLGTVASAALRGGAAELEQFQLEVLHPVAPMLAQTAADTTEALARFSGDVAFEWKVDGARIQVHKAAATVRIYTRNLNDVTAALPEIAELARTLTADELVLDGEAIALTAAGRPHPFQVTMRRFGRKLDIETLRSELPMQAFFFDCLRLDGRSLADRPSRERFNALARAVPDSLQIPRLITSSPEAAQEFYEQALAAGHEGVMAKALDAPYAAGNRGASWLKIKRVHTLDLVILAAEGGHGRRTGLLSNLHLGALDTATGDYVMLGKTFKGLTDAMLRMQTERLLELETRRDRYTVYVRPEQVVEIAFSDLQARPRYPGGIAVRLARVKRYRDDKTAAEADTMETVRRIYDSLR